MSGLSSSDGRPSDFWFEGPEFKSSFRQSSHSWSSVRQWTELHKAVCTKSSLTMACMLGLQLYVIAVYISFASDHCRQKPVGRWISQEIHKFGVSTGFIIYHVSFIIMFASSMKVPQFKAGRNRPCFPLVVKKHLLCTCLTVTATLMKNRMTNFSIS